MLSIWSNINDSFIKFTSNIKDFFINNSRNPFLWIGIILIGLVIFELVYKALNKDK